MTVRCLCLTCLLVSSISIADSSIDFQYLDARIEKLIQQDDMFGLSIAVVEGGELAFIKGYGHAYPGGPPIDRHTRFRWASLSKGVAGSLLGLLAFDEKIALDDPIVKFDTSLRLPNLGDSRATITDLLSHRLGIVPNAYDTRLEDGLAPKRIRASLGSLASICPPGSCHTYQNVAFDTATEIVEKITGASFERLVQQRIFDPLEMDSASLNRAEMISSRNYARPHRRSKGSGQYQTIPVNEIYYRVPAAGGVNSSILDLATYMRAQMGLINDVLPQQVLETIHAPQVVTPIERRRLARRFDRLNDAKYGLGWRVYDYNGNTLIGHRGAVNGYRALILFDTNSDTGVVAMWNSSSGRPVGLQFEVMDMSYGLPRRDWIGIDVLAKIEASVEPSSRLEEEEKLAK